MMPPSPQPFFEAFFIDLGSGRGEAVDFFVGIDSFVFFTTFFLPDFFLDILEDFVFLLATTLFLELIFRFRTIDSAQFPLFFKDTLKFLQNFMGMVVITLLFSFI